MRALQVTSYGDLSGLSLTELPSRSPSKGEVTIRVAAVGVGYFDALLVKGEYQIKPPLPFTPGSAFSGEIMATGEGVSHLKIGDKVVGTSFLGALAEVLTLDAQACFTLDEGVDLINAANFCVPYATALYGLKNIGQLQPGETLLVLGAAGTTGITAIEIGKAMGANVIAAASTEEKRNRAIAAGADAAVDYRHPEWRKHLQAITGGSVNVVYDPIGGALSETALRLLAPGGRHLIVGFVAGIPSIPMNLPLLKRCSIHGVNWGQAKMADPALATPIIRELCEMAAAGKLDNRVDASYSLNEAGDAFAKFFQRESVGKVVIRPH